MEIKKILSKLEELIEDVKAIDKKYDGSGKRIGLHHLSHAKTYVSSISERILEVDTLEKIAKEKAEAAKKKAEEAKKKKEEK
jgi:hypothetical protein